MSKSKKQRAEDKAWVKAAQEEWEKQLVVAAMAGAAIGVTLIWIMLLLLYCITGA